MESRNNMSEAQTERVAIRDYTGEDRNFVLATWLRGLRYGNEFYQSIPSDIYFAEYQKVLDHILESPMAVVRVACLESEPTVILGYSVSHSNVLDWVFVKKNWRNIGIAKSLLPLGIQKVSHLTKVGKSLLFKYKHLQFDPFSVK